MGMGHGDTRIADLFAVGMWEGHIADLEQYHHWVLDSYNYSAYNHSCIYWCFYAEGHVPTSNNLILCQEMMFPGLKLDTRDQNRISF